MKRYLIIIVLFVLFSCGGLSESDKREAEKTIDIVRSSINSQKKEVYLSYSEVAKFYEFNSILYTFGKKGGESSFFNTKIDKISGNKSKIKAEIFVSYNIELKSIFDEIKLDSEFSNMPKELVEKIIEFGLPDKMTFELTNKNGRYILTKINFPIKYFFMNIFIN